MSGCNQKVYISWNSGTAKTSAIPHSPELPADIDLPTALWYFFALFHAFCGPEGVKNGAKNEKFGDVRWFNEFFSVWCFTRKLRQKTQAFALGATHFTLGCPVPKTFFSFIIHFTSRILGECFVSGDDEMEWNAMLGMLIIIKNSPKEATETRGNKRNTCARWKYENKETIVVHLWNNAIVWWRWWGIVSYVWLGQQAKRTKKE